MPRLVTSVTEKRGRIPPAIPINIHWYGVSRSWMGMRSWWRMENVLCNCLDGSWSSLNWSRSRCSVSQFKGFIGSMVLVDIFCNLIPAFRRSIGGASKSHGGYSVLDLGVEPLSELDYGRFQVCIPCFCYQLYQLIQIIVYGPGLSVDSSLFIAATLECGGQKSFWNSFQNSSQLRNFEYPSCLSSHSKTHSAHLAARPDFIYDMAHVILMCSLRNKSRQRCIYVWQDVRKDCPRERFPSYSLGNAGGGGHPVGAAWMGIGFVEQICGQVGMFACMSFSRC